LFIEQERSCQALLFIPAAFCDPKFSFCKEHFPPVHSLVTGTPLASLHLWPIHLSSQGAWRQLGLPKVVGTQLSWKRERRGKKEERRSILGAWDKGQNRNQFSGPFLKIAAAEINSAKILHLHCLCIAWLLLTVHPRQVKNILCLFFNSELKIKSLKKINFLGRKGAVQLKQLSSADL